MTDFDVAKIKLFPHHFAGQELTFKGWVKTNRGGKELGFLGLNDGLSFHSLQIVYQKKLTNFLIVNKLLPGSAIKVTGKVILLANHKEKVELLASKIVIINPTASDYFLQKKKHSKEFLRTKSELRARSNYFYALFQIRNKLSWAVHHFFHQKNFFQLHPPIITKNDCEGGGETFKVAYQKNNEIDIMKRLDAFKKFIETANQINEITIDKQIEMQKENLEVDNQYNNFSNSLFALANLTVSGQLHAEAFAQIYRHVYTFAPTFRADKSNTRFHSAEFWMVEPEMAFADLKEIITLTESMIKAISKEVYINCQPELQYLSQFHNLELLPRIEKLVQEPFLIITYQEAITLLNLPWGHDFTKKEELALTEHYGNKPLFVTDFPAQIKAFYMKRNPDQKTVACFDLFLPFSGEIAGGSQREEDYQTLLESIQTKRFINDQELTWYLNLRKQGYGGSAGCGVGLDRLLMYLTGADNIRDTIPFYVGFKSVNY